MLACAALLAALPTRADEGPPAEPSALPAEGLDAAAAVRQALESSHVLAVARLEVDAARAEAAFGGRWDNPELSMEWEEFGISRPAWKQSELTFRIEQAIPLGGRLGAGREAASARAGRMESRLRLTASQLETQVREAHLAALAEQARTELLAESLLMARKVLDAVRTGIELGQSAPADEHLALAEYRGEEVAMRRAQARLDELKAHLAAYWGGSASQVGRLAGSLEPAPVSPVDGAGPCATTGEGALQPLVLAPIAALREEKRAVLALEEQRRLPELSIMGGFRGMEGFSEQAFVAGVSIPLPAWNRHKAEIETASLEVRRAEALLRARQREWHGLVAAERSAAFTAWQDYQGIRDGVLPELEKGLAAVLEAFRGGDAGSLDVLDAQRRVLAARMQMLEAAEATLAAGIRLEGLLQTSSGQAETGADARYAGEEVTP
jgi:cobalt-zinc-cadmium efflux system outer membrane protein